MLFFFPQCCPWGITTARVSGAQRHPCHHLFSIDVTCGHESTTLPFSRYATGHDITEHSVRSMSTTAEKPQLPHSPHSGHQPPEWPHEHQGLRQVTGGLSRKGMKAPFIPAKPGCDTRLHPMPVSSCSLQLAASLRAPASLSAVITLERFTQKETVPEVTTH